MPNVAENPYERACRDHNKDQHTGEGTGDAPRRDQQKTTDVYGVALSESYYRHHRYGEDQECGRHGFRTDQRHAPVISTLTLLEAPGVVIFPNELEVLLV
jgi:hypothetical protein